MRFKLRRSAVKAALKLHFGRYKRNTPTSLTAATRSFAAPISALRAPTIGLLSVPWIGGRGRKVMRRAEAAGADCIVQKN